jgi:transcriptional activator of cad operon
MESTKGLLCIGDWRVNGATGEIARADETIRLETRAMRLLLCLAERPGEVVSIDELLTQVWGEISVSQDSVYQAVASLRRVLGDDPKKPSYIATEPRLGYRMVAKVTPWIDSAAEALAASDGESAVKREAGRGRWFWAVVAAGFAGLLVVIVVHGKIANDDRAAANAVLAQQTQRSIAVLPFLDLTEGMKQEEFADGMTEELIDKLSKIPGLRVPAPTASFFYKGKQLPVAEMAKALGVAYVLDGSVRKAGDRVRVAARLVRAENGYVMWTENYDRPFGDILMVQDDIAGEVTKALKASIGDGSP